MGRHVGPGHRGAAGHRRLHLHHHHQRPRRLRGDVRPRLAGLGGNPRIHGHDGHRGLPRWAACPASAARVLLDHHVRLRGGDPPVGDQPARRHPRDCGLQQRGPAVRELFRSRRPESRPARCDLGRCSSGLRTDPPGQPLGLRAGAAGHARQRTGGSVAGDPGRPAAPADLRAGGHRRRRHRPAVPVVAALRGTLCLQTDSSRSQHGQRWYWAASPAGSEPCWAWRSCWSSPNWSS